MIVIKKVNVQNVMSMSKMDTGLSLLKSKTTNTPPLNKHNSIHTILNILNKGSSFFITKYIRVCCKIFFLLNK